MTSKYTPEYLQRLREAREAATTGEWYRNASSAIVRLNSPQLPDGIIANCENIHLGPQQCHLNAAFAVTAANEWNDLIAEIERLRGELEVEIALQAENERLRAVIREQEKQNEDMQNEIERLRGELQTFERKIAHGCTDATCKECDG